MSQAAPPDKYGDILKIVQIGFYIIGGIVAILTYLAARRGLLNTVNTEYQKRVMDRLHKLSEDLYSESQGCYGRWLAILYEKVSERCCRPPGFSFLRTNCNGVNQIYNSGLAARLVRKAMLQEGERMTTPEQAAQIWPILVISAKNHHLMADIGTATLDWTKP